MLKRMFPLITSLFCQNAGLAIPTLAVVSYSHLASSDIQLPKYLNLVTCSNYTPSKVKHACDPFSAPSPPTTTTFFFLTLISIPYSLQVSFVEGVWPSGSVFASHPGDGSSNSRDDRLTRN